MPERIGRRTQRGSIRRHQHHLGPSRRIAERIGDEHEKTVLDAGHEARRLGDDRGDEPALRYRKRRLLFDRLALLERTAGEDGGEFDRELEVALLVELAHDFLKRRLPDVERSRFDDDVAPRDELAEEVPSVDRSGDGVTRAIPRLVRSDGDVELRERVLRDSDGFLGLHVSESHANLEGPEVDELSERDRRRANPVAVGRGRLLEDLVALGVFDLE